MPVARCIVCERSEKWAVALRRPLQNGRAPGVETRSLDECWNEVVGQSGQSRGGGGDARRIWSRWCPGCGGCRRVSAARVVVLGSRGLEAGQWLLREAGAVHVVFSPREWPPVVRIVQRHLGAAAGPGDSRSAARLATPAVGGLRRT